MSLRSIFKRGVILLSKKEAIYIRVTTEEKEMIQKKAADNKMSVTALIINSVQKNINVNLDTTDYRKLVIQFRRIGNNINSIIRDIRFSNFFSNTDVIEIQNNLKSLTKIMEEEKREIRKTKSSFENISPSQLKELLVKEKKKVPMYLVYEEIESHIILQLRSFVDLIIQEKLNETYPSYIDFFIKKFDSTNFNYEELVLFSDDLDKVIFDINRRLNTGSIKIKDEDFLNVMEVLNKYRKVSDK